MDAFLLKMHLYIFHHRSYKHAAEVDCSPALLELPDIMNANKTTVGATRIPRQNPVLNPEPSGFHDIPNKLHLPESNLGISGTTLGTSFGSFPETNLQMEIHYDDDGKLNFYNRWYLCLQRMVSTYIGKAMTQAKVFY